MVSDDALQPLLREVEASVVPVLEERLAAAQAEAEGVRAADDAEIEWLWGTVGAWSVGRTVRLLCVRCLKQG